MTSMGCGFGSDLDGIETGILDGERALQQSLIDFSSDPVLAEDRLQSTAQAREDRVP
ncbi:hypothetical protein [Streptomyces netropsis]